MIINIIDIIKSIDLSKFPIRFVLSIRESENPFSATHSNLIDTVQLNIGMHVREIDTGEMTKIASNVTLNLNANKSDIEHIIFHQIKEMLIHELKECFIINGKQVMNPHPETK